MALDVDAGSWRYIISGQRRITLRANDLGLSAVNRNSACRATVTELDSDEHEDIPQVGDAWVAAGGVAPHDDGTMDVQVTVNWNSPLRTRLTVFVAR